MDDANDGSYEVEVDDMALAMMNNAGSVDYGMHVEDATVYDDGMVLASDGDDVFVEGDATDPEVRVL